jgi:hypothetical protein
MQTIYFFRFGFNGNSGAVSCEQATEMKETKAVEAQMIYWFIANSNTKSRVD